MAFRDGPGLLQGAADIADDSLLLERRVVAADDKNRGGDHVIPHGRSCTDLDHSDAMRGSWERETVFPCQLLEQLQALRGEARQGSIVEQPTLVLLWADLERVRRLQVDEEGEESRGLEVWIWVRHRLGIDQEGAIVRVPSMFDRVPPYAVVAPCPLPPRDPSLTAPLQEDGPPVRPQA